ncbi:MAG: hypothetical protein ACP5IC_01250 [Minisyncoccia bacterium]
MPNNKITILTGIDNYRKNIYLLEKINEFKKQNFEIIIINCDDFEQINYDNFLDIIMNDIKQDSLFFNNKLIIIKNINKELFNQINKYFKTTNSYIIITTNDSITLDNKNYLIKNFDDLENKKDLQNFLNQELKNNNIILQPDAYSYLINTILPQTINKSYFIINLVEQIKLLNLKINLKTLQSLLLISEEIKMSKLSKQFIYTENIYQKIQIIELLVNKNYDYLFNSLSYYSDNKYFILELAYYDELIKKGLLETVDALTGLALNFIPKT